MLETDFVFPRSYDIVEVPELPGTGNFDVPVHYFQEPGHRPEHSGSWLKIVPATGKSWIGVFAFLFESQNSFSRVVSTPDPKRVCVVSGCAGYMVNVEEPETWGKIVVPVLGVQSLPKHELLVFSDYTGLAANGRDGLAWRSKRLCWDELKIVKVTDTIIEGTGYDPTNSVSNQSHFAVEIATGRSLLPAPSYDRNGRPVW